MTASNRKQAKYQAFPCGNRGRRGFSLLEMVVVLIVLAVLAGALVPILSRDLTITRPNGEDVSSSRAVTETTMVAVRDAVMGSPAIPGYRADLLGRLPGTMRSLFDVDLALPTELRTYDPALRRGWHGPYLVRSTGTYHVDVLRGFSTDYGAEGDPAVVDGWGRPIVLQYVVGDADRKFVRLISAGEDGTIQTSNSDASAFARGDDVVLFLRRTDVP